VQYETILVEKRDGTAIVTLNRPKKLNAVNLEMKLEVLDTLDELEVDEDIRAVIFTGAGRAFCAGADISRFGEDSPELRKQEARTKDMIRRIYEFEKPIIGAINGIAAGEGSQWVLAFDLNVISEEAKLAWPATRLGTL
jgi:enoyl-CoA hydratase/carnithine racemase